MVKQMKKLLMGIALIIPVAWAGILWVTSNKTEEVFEGMLAESNQKIAEEVPFVKIEKQSFEKGLLTSTAKSLITLDPEILDNEEPLSVTLEHTIYHGPVMMTPNGIKTGTSYIFTTLDQESLSSDAREVIDLLFDGKEPIVSGILTGLDENVDVDLKVVPLHFDSEQFDVRSGTSSEDKMILSLDGMSGQFATNAEGTRIKGVLDFGILKLLGKEDGKNINMTMAASVTEMNVEEIYKGSILDGSAEVKIPEISFSDGEGSGFTLEGVTFLSASENQNGSISGVGTIDVDKLRIKKIDAPVAFPESSVHMNFGLKGLEREALMKFIDAGKEMNKSQFVLLGSDDPQQSSDALTTAMSTYFNTLGEVLRQGVEMNNVIEISNNSGKSSVKLDLLYVDSKKLLDLRTIKDVIMALKSQLKISIDKKMIAGTPAEEAIGMPLAMGFAVDMGEVYEAVADLSSGELKVNGEPMPVLDMLGAMVDQPLPWAKMQGL